MLEAYESTPGAGRMLVLAPLSILQPSWGGDITKFTQLSYTIAHGSEKKRQAAFESPARVVIMNHDGVNWLAKNTHLLRVPHTGG